MATIYISIQGSYQFLELALFNDSTCVKYVTFQDKKASSFLIPFLENLLREFSYNLSDLSFIAVDKGPGAFTSLRVVIATLNGMGFARQIPLIGIDGLQALYQQTCTNLEQKSYPDVIVCVLNAYGKEVYFLVQQVDNNTGEPLDIPQYGYKNFHSLQDELHKKYLNQMLLFTGNGSEMYYDSIKATFGDYALMEHALVQTASACEIGKIAYQKWLEDQSCAQTALVPHYIKTQFFAMTR